MTARSHVRAIAPRPVYVAVDRGRNFTNVNPRFYCSCYGVATTPSRCRPAPLSTAGALPRNGAVTLDTNRINRTSGCGYGVAAYVAPPSGNVLPAHLGVPPELQGTLPWLLTIGLGAAAGAIVLGVTGRRRRRTN
jgi:hypothetical protein